MSVMLLAGVNLPTACQAQADTEAFEQGEALLLEASVNGIAKGLIIQALRRDGQMFVPPSELQELGIDTQGLLPADAVGRVALERVPGLRYTYQRESQRIDLRVDATRQLPEVLGETWKPPPTAQSGTGLTVNYSVHLQAESVDQTTRSLQRLTAPTLYGESRMREPPGPLSAAPDPSYDLGASPGKRHTKSAGLYTDSRLFTPIGTLYHTAFGTHTELQDQLTRLDTSWVMTDPKDPRTLLLGDYITSSLLSTRPVRVGGIQLRSDFALRPDLVTFPVPRLGGNAVVPSSVDLLINEVSQFTGAASGGPFMFGDAPMLTGAGTATIVVRDPAGRKVATVVPLYVDARLLKAGLSDYALEAGYLRLDYGIRSSEYGSKLGGNGILRHGLSDSVTAEASLQATEGLQNGTLGGLIKVGNYGVAGLMVGASDSSLGHGTLTGLSYQYLSPRWNLDLMSLQAHNALTDIGTLLGSPVPRRRQRAVLSLPIFERQNLAASYNRIDAEIYGRTRIAALSYGASLGSRTSLFAQGFSDLDRSQTWGLYFGISVNLDGGVGTYASATKVSGRTLLSAGAGKQPNYDTGGFGWAVQADHSPNTDYSHALVRGTYLGRHGEVALAAERFDSATVSTFDARGGLIFMDGALFASRAINDAFALISTDGVADVPVLRENRVIGLTDRGGRLIVPDLRSYEYNDLSIDTLALPVQAQVALDQMLVVPRSGAGVLAHFPIGTFRGASVKLVDAQSRPLPVGARATLRASGTLALLGYDGLVFFQTLEPLNVLQVEAGGKTCEVAVPFDTSAAMTTLGPFVCVLKSTEAAP